MCGYDLGGHQLPSGTCTLAQVESSSAGIVGWAGWAFAGGFGPLVNTYGLGVDQIISARIVTADGEEKEAGPELLWGIKGAGGAFGVITELTIRVHPLTKMLGGMILFQFDQAGRIIEAVQDIFETETIPCDNVAKLPTEPDAKATRAGVMVDIGDVSENSQQNLTDLSHIQRSKCIFKSIPCVIYSQ